MSAPRDGVVTRLRALDIGVAALELGGGRRTKDDAVDHAVGLVCHVKRGEMVRRGHLLADVHASDEDSAARGVVSVLAAYELGEGGAARARDPPPRHRVARLADMPELPEVETIRSQLAPRLEGRTLVRVEILDPRLTRPIDLFEVAEELEGDSVRSGRTARGNTSCSAWRVGSRSSFTSA